MRTLDAETEVELRALRAQTEMIEARKRMDELLDAPRYTGLRLSDWAIAHPNAALALEHGLDQTAEMIRRVMERLHEQHRAGAAPAAAQPRRP